MSENNNTNTKPEIEETIKAVLSGDTLKNALDFAAYLKANGMKAGEEHGAVTFDGKVLCYMHIDGADEAPGPWTIWTDGDYEQEESAIDEQMREIVWANVNYCGSCGSDCSPGVTKVILGKSFDNVCNAAMAFRNPDPEALECVKKLLEIRKSELAL